MEQQQVWDWLKKALDEAEQEIKAQERKIKAQEQEIKAQQDKIERAVKDGEIQQLINSYMVEKARLVEEKAQLVENEKDLQIELTRLAGPAGEVLAASR